MGVFSWAGNLHGRYHCLDSLEVPQLRNKRDQTLAQRGLDFARAIEVFGGVNVSAEDARFDYGEPRFTTAGVLDGRMVIVVWSPRGEVRRIISMRKANEREIARFTQTLG